MVTGLVVWLFPFGWVWQGIGFAVLTVIAALLWTRWLARKPQPRADAALNQRGQQLIGQRFILDAPLVNGRGHMRVGDGTWPIVASEELPAGTRVEVIAVEGMTLRVRPSPP